MWLGWAGIAINCGFGFSRKLVGATDTLFQVVLIQLCCQIACFPALLGCLWMGQESLVLVEGVRLLLLRSQPFVLHLRICRNDSRVLLARLCSTLLLMHSK